ncbi:MAG: sporulation protein YqfD [Firmicutes bacterium]|nr:sporulation protein YqfD [Bacillota bacterium]
MFSVIWNFLSGYVIIEVKGFCIERFLNMMIYNRIPMWDMEKTAGGVKFKIHVRNFRSIKKFARKTKCKFRITDRNGCPFFIYKHRKKKLYVVGAVLFVFIIYLLSSFIWLIEIEGNSRISSADILAFCAEKNIKEGSYKYGIDADDMEMQLKEKFPEIAWVNMEIDGTLATIKITETLPSVSIRSYSAASNIRAKTNAVIDSITVKSGTALVRVGDTVVSGETIVTGELTVKDDETGIIKKEVKSEAEVIGKYTKKIEFEVPLAFSTKKYTGNTYISYDVRVLNNIFSLNFIKKEKSFKNYDTISNEEQLYAGENYPLPIYIIKNIYSEYYTENISRSEDEAKNIAEKKINEVLLTSLSKDAEIISCDKKYSVNENVLKVCAYADILENIGNEIPYE